MFGDIILDFLLVFSALAGVSSLSLLTAGVDLMTGDLILLPGDEGETDLDDSGDDRGLLEFDSNDDLRDSLESNEDFLDSLESSSESFADFFVGV